MMDAMRKLLLGTTLTLAIAFVSPASAMPAGYPLLRDAAVSIDLIEVGGAKVGGTSTVIARLVGAAPKVGWRGYGCPPGHWKKGWCNPSSPAVHLADGSGNWTRA